MDPSLKMGPEGRLSPTMQAPQSPLSSCGLVQQEKHEAEPDTEAPPRVAWAAVLLISTLRPGRGLPAIHAPTQGSPAGQEVRFLPLESRDGRSLLRLSTAPSVYFRPSHCGSHIRVPLLSPAPRGGFRLASACPLLFPKLPLNAFRGAECPGSIGAPLPLPSGTWF